MRCNDMHPMLLVMLRPQPQQQQVAYGGYEVEYELQREVPHGWVEPIRSQHAE
jgi:hypothetical protein